MIVKASESGIANQIPDTPKNFGNKIKLGIRKTKPRNKAKIVAGFILSIIVFITIEQPKLIRNIRV